MIRMKMVAAGCLLVLGVGPIEGARPFCTDDAGVVTSGGYELELGSYFWEEEASLGLGFKYGLSERMDIGVGLGFVITPELAERFERAELSLKFSLIPDFIAASVAGILGDPAYALNAAISRSLGPLEVNANIGYDATGLSESAGSISYALNLIYGIPRLDLGGEVLGDKDGFHTWLFGGRYHVLGGLALDLGLAGGFEEEAGNEATCGIHYEF